MISTVRSILLILTALFLSVIHITAQVTIAGSTSEDGTYASLGLAFAAINGNVQTGNNIVIEISSNTTETSTASLSEGVWSSLTIYPTVTGIMISGNLNLPLISFNGADNVTLDGRVNQTGVTDLTITNSSVSATAGTSTIQFINTAENNTVQYCNIKGSETVAASGIIFFSTATTGNGNDGNTIDNNNISCNAGARPINAIYSRGSSGFDNSGNTISNNNIFDFLIQGTSSNGINISSFSTAWSITGNSFYETASFAPTATATYNIICINNTSGVNFDVSNNFIGGNSNLCGGSSWTKTNASNNVFDAVYLNVGTATPSNVQNNTISNFSWNNSQNGNWTGIYIAAGTVNIGTTTGNTIGEATGTGSVYITEGTTGGNVYGIYIAATGSGTIDCENNTISSVITDNAAANATNFYGLFKTGTGTTSFINNTIGSTSTANSINANSASTGNAQSVYGIYSSGSSTVTIDNNTIVNLNNGTTNTTIGTTGVINGITSTAGTTTISNNTIRDLTIANANNSGTNTASVCGIALTGGTLKTVSGNTIYNLSNSYTSFAGNVIGLYFTGNNGTNVVSDNFIYNLSVTGASSTTASIYAIKINTGRATYFNNIINLGGTTATDLYGIYDPGTSGNNNNLYFNTVFIGGSLSSGITNKSYALYSAASASIRNFSNNIFSNVRSTISGASLHYAAYFNYAINTNLTLDYNDYYAPGTGGVLGYYNLADVNSLPIVLTKDANSVATDPGFSNAGGTTSTDYEPSASNLGGITIAGITTDYSNATRASTPTMGALEGALNLNVDVYISGIFQATYLRLKDAFDKINSGTHTGAIEIRINASTSETASAVLNASGSGGANYSSINIYPTTTGLTITGNLASPLINLNGADAVTIDGRVNATGTTKDLIISNLNTGTSSSTIQFINSAENNVVKYCTIKGAETSTTRGIIYFTTATAGNGNDNNTIENNNITNISGDAAGRPINAIYSLGSTGFENSENIISNNNIYDFLKQGTASYGINISTFSTAWTITGNNFYETTPFIPIASVTYNVIYISNISGINFTVSDNFIGGSSSSCGGTAWTKTNAFNNIFNAVYLNVGTGTVSEVQNNKIQNIVWGNSLNAAWTAINIAAGDINFGTTTGNIIGASTGTSSVTITNTTSGANVIGVNIASSGIVNCQNNIIGSITVDNVSATNATNFYGIYKSGSSGTLTTTNNTIGSTSTANSINANSASTSNTQSVFGIYSAGNSTISINNNTIANLTNGTTNTTAGTRGLINGITSTNGTNSISNNTIRDLTIANANNASTNAAAVCGIALTGASLKTVTGNSIYNLSNNYTSFAGSIIGIYFTGSTGANVVSENFIHSLSITGPTTTTPSLFGIRIAAGATTYSNNIINLGGNTPSTIYGIYETGAAANNNNLYFNTIYIDGVPTSGTLNSYALYNASNTNTRNFRNNIFVNARSNSGATGKHYAIYLAGLTNLTIDYNDYYTSGTGSVLGYYTADRTYLSDWKVATLQDINSISLNPNFASAGGTTATNYVASSSSLYAISGTGISTDYAGTTRINPPTMGAFEGTLSTPVVAVYLSNIKTGNYNSLQAAFNAINSGTHTGILEIRINANLFEVSSVLNASGSGGANYSSIHIYPTLTGLSILGNVAAPLIDLNGADNVTIDGRVNATGSTKDLIITNTGTSATAGTSTIRFINDASNNTVKYATLKGSETSTTSGIIFFSTAVAGGNDGNSIDNNNITNSVDANRPINGIFSLGSAANENSGNIITNNYIYDILSRGSTSNVIQFGANNTASTITANSIYETASFIPTSSVTYNGILISNTGSGFTVNGNYIGGQTANCAGSAWTKTINLNNTFAAINLSIGNATTTQIQNNTIRNFSWSNSANAAWTGINIAAGDVNIGTTTGNIIGATTGTGSITVTSTTSAGNVYGINISSTGIVDCQNNSIGSINVANVNATNATNFYGIYKSASAGTTTISNNIIGSTLTANSINANSASTSNAQSVFGIYTAGNGTININNNTIANLNNGTTNTTGGTLGVINGITSTNGTNNFTNNTIHDLSIANANNSGTNTASVCGIALTAATLKTVNGNTIYNLSNSFNTFAGSIIGIYFTVNTGANFVSENFIHNLSVASASTSAFIYGIKIAAGATTYSNNIITLGGNTATTIYGIYETGVSSNNNNLYFNTLYIGGNLNSGITNKSYALYSALSSNIRNFRNNIFMNARSTISGTNLHYAIYFNYGVNTNLTLNYNDYYTNGTGGVLGYYNSTNVNSLPLIVTKDVNSNATDPILANAGGTLAIDYKISANLLGETGTGITTDYASNIRTGPSIGAWEKMINKWKGSISSAWNTIGNWTENTLPATDANIFFDNTPLNNCQLDQNRSITDITNAQATYKLQTNGFKLTIKGNINFTNGAQIDATSTNSIIEFAGNSAQSIESGCFASGSIDNLTIDNSVGVTINTDLTINNSLTINSGKLLTLTPTRSMTVVGNITNNAGVSGLIIQASSSAANGSLVFHNSANSPVPATIEMYSKAFCLTPATNSNYQWQYFGIPVRSIVAEPTFNNSWVRKWDETLDAPNNHWVSLNNSSVLTSFTGYEITQNTAKTLTIQGNLENKDTTFVMDYTSTASYPGQHIYGNPYLAAIDITKLTFGTEAEATVYLYNTGSYADWTSNGGETSTGTNPGQFLSVPKNNAGQPGLPLEIPSMQGFLVKALSSSPNATLGISYSSVVIKNTDQQRVPATDGISATEKVSTIIDVKGTHTSDRMWIFTEPNSTRGFDNGWDGQKIMGSALTPQLFAIEADGNYQVNTVPDMNGTELAFQAGQDLEDTLIFTHHNIESRYARVYLVDLQENRTIDITSSGTQYPFMTESTPTPLIRFKIVTRPYEKNAVDAESQLKIFSANGTVFVQNLSNKTGYLKLFDMSGCFVKEIQFDGNNITSFSGNLVPGAYIACAVTSIESVNKRIIIK